MKTNFISIVGVSRSGTTLMRSILNASDQITICSENHFLGHLVPWEGARYRFRKFGDLSDDDNVRKLVDYIYSGGLERDFRKHGYIGHHWIWIVKWVDKSDFLQRILASDRSERALFTVMMQVQADRRGRPIMGEKTPAHVRYVPTMLEWFPDGRIIHMIRDPRGNFVSEWRRRKKLPVTTPYKQLQRFDALFTLYIVLQTTLAWFESISRYRKYKVLYPDNYYPMRFEDLVSDPETHIRRVCDFLGVEFQDKMLDQAVVSRGFKQGQDGFDARAATRWREHIPPWVDTWFLFWFKKRLKELGYLERMGTPAPLRNETRGPGL
jgi:hypothetical protein